jgi:hypothetical protein
VAARIPITVPSPSHHRPITFSLPAHCTTCPMTGIVALHKTRWQQNPPLPDQIRKKYGRAK